MGKVTESIFNGETVIIPMADVQYIEKHKNSEDINVIFSGSTWNAEIDYWNNIAYLRKDEANSFMKCWCRYRYELESESIVIHQGAPELLEVKS